MKYYVLLLTILALTTANNYSQKLTPKEVFNEVNNSVVKILCYDYYDVGYSQGSGVVLLDSNIIITNYHVFDRAEKIIVEHYGKTYYSMKILAADPQKDILIIKCDSMKLKPMVVANPTELEIGDKVFAVGSPLGYENSITEGIVSGLRTYGITNEWIQISAGITHGSSGGAVVNDKGELIGISSGAIEATNINLNFAIPVSMLKNLKDFCLREDTLCLRKIEYYYKAYNRINFLKAMFKYFPIPKRQEQLKVVFDLIVKYILLETNNPKGTELLFSFLKKFETEKWMVKKMDLIKDSYGQGFPTLIKGLNLLMEKDYYAAYSAFIEALNEDIANKYYYYFYAYALYEYGNVDAAIYNMFKATENGDDDARLWLKNIGYDLPQKYIIYDLIPQK